jgi:hypothetical protein
VFGVDAPSGRWKPVLCVANVEGAEAKRCLGLGEGGAVQENCARIAVMTGGLYVHSSVSDVGHMGLRDRSEIKAALFFPRGVVAVGRREGQRLGWSKEGPSE